MRKHKLILNPWAGRGAGGRIRAALLGHLAAHGLYADLDVTEGPRDAIRLARHAADSHDVVVAVGGDGTVHEVVNGLAQAANGGVTAPLGVIPIGTGDDFAYMIGLARNGVEEAVTRLAQGTPRLVDLGRVNDEYFDNEVGVAFSGQANIESRKISAPLGPLVYLIAVFRCLMGYPLPHLRIAWEGGSVERDILLASIANGQRTGGQFWIAPQADIEDGVFDLVFANAIGRLEILRLLPKVMKGTHIYEPPVSVVRSSWVTIDAPGGIPVHADGELLYSHVKHLDFELLPKKLRVIV